MAATVGTSLQIFDSFSNVLNRFNNGLHQAITNSNHLHQTLQNPLSPNLPGSNMQTAHSSPAGNIGQAIQGSLQQIIHLNQQMVSILSKQQQMATQQGQVTRNMQATHAEAGGLAETLKGVVATYLSIEAVHKAIEFMNWGDEIAGANARLSLMNDGTQTQLELQQKVMAVANDTRQAYAETAKMVAQLGSSTQGVFKSNQDVLDFTSRFNKLLVTGGANAEESKSAILQMSQALSSGVLQGDELRSLSETAPMLMKVLADGLGVARGSLKQMGADGELTSAKIVAAFAKQDAYINQLFAKMPVTFGQAMTLGKNKAAEWVATINGANGPLQKLTQSLMSLMTSKQGEGFMNGFTASIRLAADGVAWFVGLVSNHMGLVKNILLSVGIVLGVLAAQMIVTWVAAAWPILAVIAAIALFITILNKLGVSTQTIVGVVAGLFSMLFAFLWNKVAYLWNVILSFAEFFVNVFIDPVYAVQKLFYDLSKDFLGHLYNMVRGAEDFSSSFSKTMLEGVNLAIQGFNWMIDAINKIPGFKIEPAKLLDENNVHTVSDSLKNMMDQLEKPTTDKNVVDLSRYKMQEKSMGAAFNSGMEYGTGLFATMSNAMDGLKEKGDAWSTIDKVNEIGKIKDKVDISSEDLKVMRELAEMQNIQNFVTLTPTVQVTTGDINHPTDVNEIIRQIEEVMVKEVANSAQGTY